MYLFYGDAVLAAVVGVIFTVFYLLSKYISRDDDYWADKGVPYAPRMSVWTTYRAITTKPMHEMLLENYKKYGKVHGAFEFPPTPNVIVGDPNLLRDILVKDFHVFPTRRDMSFAQEMLDNMVTVKSGEDWKRIRTIMTPAFTSRRMRKMGSIINDCSKTIIETFEKHYQEKKSVDCKRIFGAFTMDVIASAAFATKIDSHNDPENAFAKHARKTFIDFSLLRFILITFLPKPIVWLFGLSNSPSMDFFRSVVENVVKERKKTGQRYNDVLQILMDAVDEQKSEDIIKEHSELLQDDVDQYGSIISDKETTPSKLKKLQEIELLAQCVLFFTVGYETSASTLTFLCYCLALNPEWQEKLIKEVDDAYAQNKEMSYDTVRDMKILDAALSESLRMFPPLLASERECVEDYKLGDTGITLKKGMRINFPIYAMHYDPDYFEDPHTYNPGRFMTSDPHHPQYAYLPFGAGPRNCLGMRFALLEIKVCVANILRHFRFRKAPETKVPLDYSKTLGFMTVTKLPLAVEKRTDVKN